MLPRRRLLGVFVLCDLPHVSLVGLILAVRFCARLLIGGRRDTDAVAPAPLVGENMAWRFFCELLAMPGVTKLRRFLDVVALFDSTPVSLIGEILILADRICPRLADCREGACERAMTRRRGALSLLLS